MHTETTLLKQIEPFIYFIRGHRVMLDQDLAKMYGVPTKVLLQAVKRNQLRFPADFMYQLTRQEVINLRSQFVTSSLGYGGRRYLPYVFTEQGVAMLSTVLKSETAILTNIAIMRTFVQLRQILSTNKELSAKLDQLERKTEKHDAEIQAIFSAIRQLMKPQEPVRRRIGF